MEFSSKDLFSFRCGSHQFSVQTNLLPSDSVVLLSESSTARHNVMDILQMLKGLKGSLRGQ